MSKCYRCAELRNCYAGRHGYGNIDCQCFSPVLLNKRMILEKTEDWSCLFDCITGNVYVEGHVLNTEDILEALGIDFIQIDLE